MPSAMEVTAWVANYDDEDMTLSNLNDMTAGTNAPRFTVTTLCVQFYLVQSNGSFRYKFPMMEKILPEVQHWCTENGVTLLATIYNNDDEWVWNWDQAAGAFENNKWDHISNLVRLCRDQNFDGIDIDYELIADGEYGAYRFGNRIAELDRVPYEGGSADFHSLPPCCLARPRSFTYLTKT